MTSQTIRIGIPGALGRMGRMLIREIDAAPGLEPLTAQCHMICYSHVRALLCTVPVNKWIMQLRSMAIVAHPSNCPCVRPNKQ